MYAGIGAGGDCGEEKEELPCICTQEKTADTLMPELSKNLVVIIGK